MKTLLHTYALLILTVALLFYTMSVHNRYLELQEITLHLSEQVREIGDRP